MFENYKIKIKLLFHYYSRCGLEDSSNSSKNNLFRHFIIKKTNTIAFYKLKCESQKIFIEKLP